MRSRGWSPACAARMVLETNSSGGERDADRRQHRWVPAATQAGWFAVMQAPFAMFAWLVLLAAVAIANPPGARAATITGASIASQGGAVELRFATHGRGLGWHLSIHGQELWIDLDNVRVQLAPRPLLGQEIAPVATVRAIYGGATSGRIVVEVKGRIDYVVGQLPHELILRLAPAGEVPNLAAPILTRMERRRYAPPPPSVPASSPQGVHTAIGEGLASAGNGSRA